MTPREALSDYLDLIEDEFGPMMSAEIAGIVRALEDEARQEGRNYGALVGIEIERSKVVRSSVHLWA